MLGSYVPLFIGVQAHILKKLWLCGYWAKDINYQLITTQCSEYLNGYQRISSNCCAHLKKQSERNRINSDHLIFAETKLSILFLSMFVLK